MFPHKIFKQTLRAEFPREFKSLKVLAVHRYTDESEGFFGSPDDPYWVASIRIGTADITLEYFSSLCYVVIDKYSDKVETLFEGSVK